MCISSKGDIAEDTQVAARANARLQTSGVSCSGLKKRMARGSRSSAISHRRSVFRCFGTYSSAR